MKLIQYYILFWFILLSLFGSAQEISNIHFEQVGKQIHIYYDLEGDQEYTIWVYCSTDNGKTWGKPLQDVTGSVGEGQINRNGKKIIWEVLNEREQLAGNVLFKIDATLSSTGYFTDTRDGQIYKWVKIGEQVWMAENLNFKAKSGCWAYDNDLKNAAIYGLLYDWNAALSACPEEWHLPKDIEWKTLELHLGMSQGKADQVDSHGTDEGQRLKSANGWWPEGNGTDETGFSALPGGFHGVGEYFAFLIDLCVFWSDTEYSSSQAWCRGLENNNDSVLVREVNRKVYGFSVRCIRD